MHVVVEEDRLNVGENAHRGHALEKRTVRDLHVHDPEAHRVFAVLAEGFVGVKHPLDRAVPDRVDRRLHAALHGRADEIRERIGFDRADPRGRGIVRVGRAKKRGARAETSVHKELQGPDFVHRVARHRARTVARTEEVFEPRLFHEAALMIDPHARVFFEHFRIEREHVPPVVASHVHRMYRRHAALGRVREGCQQRLAVGIAVGRRENVRHLRRGVLAENPGRAAVFVSVDRAARKGLGFIGDARHLHRRRARHKNVTAGALENERDAWRRFVEVGGAGKTVFVLEVVLIPAHAVNHGPRRGLTLGQVGADAVL